MQYREVFTFLPIQYRCNIERFSPSYQYNIDAIYRGFQPPNCCLCALGQVVETLAKLHIVMEYAGGGELFTRISNEGKFPEPEARHIFAQVAAAMEHMVNQAMKLGGHRVQKDVLK